jgi:predicted DNA-binding antitoxin AbrB/MazE fold protein
MAQVDAIYQGGVFKPLTPVALDENQRVLLQVDKAEGVKPENALAWMAEISRRREQFAAAHGFLPDSTIDIAEDRRR